MLDFFKKKSEHRNIYFQDSLLEMGYSGRLAVRVVANAWVIVHVVGTAVLLLTDIPWVFWLGVLSSLYLLDRLVHYSAPEEYLPLDNESYGNLVLYLSPRARRAVISAYNRATILGGGFFLNLARVLSETKPILEMLSRLEVNDKEFNSKLDVYLEKDAVSYRDKERLLNEVERLIFASFGNRKEGQKSMDYVDLFAALGGIDNEQLTSLFRVFEISGPHLNGVTIFGALIGPLARLNRRRFMRSIKILTTERAVSLKVLELEREYSVYVLYSSILTAIVSAKKYSYDKPLVESAEGLMHEAIIYVSKRGDDIVRSNDVVAATEKLINEN